MIAISNNNYDKIIKFSHVKYTPYFINICNNINNSPK